MYRYARMWAQHDRPGESSFYNNSTSHCQFFLGVDGSWSRQPVPPEKLLWMNISRFVSLLTEATSEPIAGLNRRLDGPSVSTDPSPTTTTKKLCHWKHRQVSRNEFGISIATRHQVGIFLAALVARRQWRTLGSYPRRQKTSWRDPLMQQPGQFI